MSLVGPRPEVPYHVEHFKEEILRYLVRQQVRPGCTGWAQIHGLRGDTDIAERIRYDIWYIENWTVALDIKIIFRTVFGGKMVNDKTTITPVRYRTGVSVMSKRSPRSPSFTTGLSATPAGTALWTP